MKSRMKKLLAAALALCLIAALVPGAALAASTPTGNFSTVNEQAPTEKTEYHDTLAEAVKYVSDFANEQYKVITVEVDNAEVSGALGSDITLKAEGKNLVVTGDLTIYGTVEDAGDIDANHDVTVSSGGSLELGGTMNIARGQTATISGTLEGSGTIVAEAGTKGTKGGVLSANNGNISESIDITANAYTEVVLPSNYKLGGTLSVAEYATAKVNGGTLNVTGSVTIDENGTVGCAINVSDGNVVNSGTIDGNVVIDSPASFTIKGSNSSFDSAEVNGTLTVEGVYKFSTSSSTLTGIGTLEVASGAEVTLPSNYGFSGEIDVADGAKLYVGNSEKIGSSTIDGDVVLSKDGSTTVITVGTAVVSGAVTIDDDEKLVVDNTLTVANNLSVNGTVQVNGRVDINANRSLTAKAILGSGRIYVSGELYNDSQSNAGSVKIQIVGNGFVYSKSAALGDNVENGDVTSGSGSYTNVWQLGEGSIYDIAVVPGNNGNVINPPASGVSGTQVSITTSPADGYEVDPANTYYMVGNTRYNSIGINGNVCSFVMPENDVTVHINFKKAENSSTTTEGNITVVTNHNGNGTVNASINGRTITITATASNNYYVKSIRFDSDTRTSTGNPATFKQSYTVSGTGNATVNVYVTFDSDEFTVTATNSSSRDGDVYVGTSGYANSGEFQEGKRVYIHAVPDSRDYALRTLYVYNTTTRQYIDYYEASGYDDVYYFTMPESDVNVWGYFTDGIYEITKDIDGNGSLAIRDENGNTTDVAEEGEEIRIYPSADKGYRLGDLYVTYTDSDDEDQVIYPEVEYKNNGNVDYYWFEMPEYDVEIYADFGEGDYVAWIDRSDMKNGTIRVSPNVADEDDTVSIYVTPDTGYQLDELIVEDEDGHDVTTTSLASGTRYTFRMPDSDVTVTATFKSRSYSSNFTDVPRYEWYYEAVSYVASEGLMNGVSTTQFNPNGTASRAQIVTILWRLAGEPSALTGAFTDVPAGQYYSTAVAWASRQGIVTGVGNNRFEPNSNITREQLAVILYRYAQDAGYTTSASANITGYYDYARVNSYARTAMSWAVGAGLITGTSTTTLSPQDTATRAQVATILMRFCENIAK